MINLSMNSHFALSNMLLDWSYGVQIKMPWKMKIRKDKEIYCVDSLFIKWNTTGQLFETFLQRIWLLCWCSGRACRSPPPPRRTRPPARLSTSCLSIVRKSCTMNPTTHKPFNYSPAIKQWYWIEYGNELCFHMQGVTKTMLNRLLSINHIILTD